MIGSERVAELLVILPAGGEAEETAEPTCTVRATPVSGTPAVSDAEVKKALKAVSFDASARRSCCRAAGTEKLTLPLLPLRSPHVRIYSMNERGGGGGQAL
jgi:hypothetical protein